MEIIYGTSTEYRHLIRAAGTVIAVLKDMGTTSTDYIHRDHLGSLTTITNSSGAVQERLAYDAWGQRRDATDWDGAATATELRGFTGHEHLDRTGFIHMNRRVYDPRIGRFLSPDPVTQSPENGQNYNRYSYVFNNPLRYSDPSGYKAQQIVVWAPTGGNFDGGGGGLSGLSGYFTGGIRGGPSSVSHFSYNTPNFPYLPDGRISEYYNSTSYYPGTPSVTPDETLNEVVDNNGARRLRIVTQQESDFFKDFENGREVVRREEYSGEWVTLEGFSEIAGDVIIEGAGRIFRVAGRLRNFGLPMDGRVEITTTGEEERWSEYSRTATYRIIYTPGSRIPRSVEILGY